MTEELKPCPFCGGILYHEVNPFNEHYVSCRNIECDMIVKTSDRLLSYLDVIKAINTRPVEGALRERVKRLEDALHYMVDREWTKTSKDAAKWLAEFMDVAKQALEEKL